MSPLIGGTWSSQTVETESRMVAAQGRGAGRGELLFNADRVSVLQLVDFHGWQVVTAAQQCERTSFKATELYT